MICKEGWRERERERERDGNCLLLCVGCDTYGLMIMSWEKRGGTDRKRERDLIVNNIVFTLKIDFNIHEC